MWMCFLCVLQRNLEFGVNIDVTTYRDGKRETHNPPGTAFAPVVWDFYQVHAVWSYVSVSWNIFFVFSGIFSTGIGVLLVWNCAPQFNVHACTSWGVQYNPRKVNLLAVLELTLKLWDMVSTSTSSTWPPFVLITWNTCMSSACTTCISFLFLVFLCCFCLLYQSGCSVRVLNPQTFSDSVWMLCSMLQEYFGCFVGANM